MMLDIDVFGHWKNITHRKTWKQTTTSESNSTKLGLLKEHYSQENLKANHNGRRSIPREVPTERTLLKEKSESKSQPLPSSVCATRYWKNITQRKIWKQITTSRRRRPASSLLKEHYSKKNLKANHNITLRREMNDETERTLLKEKSESKSQRTQFRATDREHWKNITQRKIWKQITTPFESVITRCRLKEHYSKKNLKANHNSPPPRSHWSKTERTLLKEKSESKSQHIRAPRLQCLYWKNITQRKIWKQITTRSLSS